MMTIGYALAADGGLTLSREWRGEPDDCPADAGPVLTLAADEKLGIHVWDGNVIKHGPADKVRQHFEVSQAAVGIHKRAMAEALKERGGATLENMLDVAAGMEDASGLIEIPVGELTEDMIEEINACLATTGRAARLAESLADMAPRSGLEP